MRTIGIAIALLAVAAPAPAKVEADRAFRFPAGTPARIVVFRPDVEVGAMGVGGVDEANAEWTATARAKLARSLAQHQRASGNEILFLPDELGDRVQLVADYQALFRVVASAVVEHKMNPAARLPTKKDRFDWTLGPEASRLRTIAGGDYALFLWTKDAFGTDARKVMQVVMGGLFGAFMPAGVHASYAGLVDLTTGNLVWFNVDPGAGGDPRTDEGAAKRIAQLLATFPAKASAPAVAVR